MDFQQQHKVDPKGVHRQFHQYCQTVFRGQPQPEGLKLWEDGFAIEKSLLSSGDCSVLTQVIDSYLANSNPERDHLLHLYDTNYEKTYGGKNFSRVATVPKPLIHPFRELLATKVFDRLGNKIESALRSYFNLSHFMIARTFPTTEASGSFLWHRDAATEAQLHILIYLTPSHSDFSGGATEVLSCSDTQQMADRGYSFLEWTKRVADLKSANAPEDLISRIQKPQMEAGDALVFFASRVLHRGVPPVSQPRDTLLLVLAPSEKPWRESLTTDALVEMRKELYGKSVLAEIPKLPS